MREPHVADEVFRHNLVTTTIKVANTLPTAANQYGAVGRLFERKQTAGHTDDRIDDTRHPFGHGDLIDPVSNRQVDVKKGRQMFHPSAAGENDALGGHDFFGTAMHGETIAVALILSAVFEINWQITEPGGNSIAANIALKWGEAADNGRSALIATGMVLFFITLVVNMTARWVVNRRRDFSGAN